MDPRKTLAGARILVVEDSYVLAIDLEDSLTGAGAEVVGPFPDEPAALQAIAQDKLSAAVADINLGAGPSFTVATGLQEAGIPFLFLTGYDASLIPSKFEAVPRLLKPIDSRHIVEELANLLA